MAEKLNQYDAGGCGEGAIKKNDFYNHRGCLLLLLKILKQIQVKNIMLMEVEEEEEAKRPKSVLFKAAA